MLYLTSLLEHEKSFLVHDAAAVVYSISVHKGSLLLTSSNDILEKDIVTGAIQRTFRAHTNLISAFVVTNDSRMITSASDDMIIIWSLESGAILKRIWLGSTGTLVKGLSLQGDQVYSGGDDGKIRHLDLVAGRVIRSRDFSVRVSKIIVSGESVYVGKWASVAPLEKIATSSFRQIMVFGDCERAVAAMHLMGNTLLASCSVMDIISWNTDTGEIMKRYQGHSLGVLAIIDHEGELYSGGWDLRIIKWSINDGQIIKEFSKSHANRIQCFFYGGQTLFSGSDDTTVLQWNISSGLPMKSFRGINTKLRSVIVWKSFAVSGGDDSEIRIWDDSINSLEPVRVLLGHQSSITNLLVYQDYLFSASSDTTIAQWNLTGMTKIRALIGHTNIVEDFAAVDDYLYSGGPDLIIRQWMITSGEQVGTFEGAQYRIKAIQASRDFVFSGSEDLVILQWSTSTTQLTRFYEVPDSTAALLLREDSLVSCSQVGLQMFSTSSGSTIADIREEYICLCLAAGSSRVYSGHLDGLIRARDLSFLSTIEIFRGHNNAVLSLFYDEKEILYSASFDGSIIKWNMATRRTAYSFENRRSSVTSMIALGNNLFVGQRDGIMNVFDMSTSRVISSCQIHNKTVSRLLIETDWIYSAGFDGMLFRSELKNTIQISSTLVSANDPLLDLAIRNNSLFVLKGNEVIEIINLFTNEIVKSISAVEPFSCVAANDMYLMAGSKTGKIIVWGLVSLEVDFQLDEHNAEVNMILAEKDGVFSASDDNTIVKWSLKDRVSVKVFKRYSSTALGHLGPVNSLSMCHGVLFSAGADRTVRRWNPFSGNHEDVYFGASKPFTTVICHNGSVFAGSEDFSVLSFKPFSLEQSNSKRITSTFIGTDGKSRTKFIKAKQASVASFTVNIGLVGALAGTAFLIILILFGCLFFRIRKSGSSSPTALTSEIYSSTTFTDLDTVVNSIMGISKHAAFLLDGSVLATVKKIATGGGGELFLVKIMDPLLAKKSGLLAIQKVVFVRSKSAQDVFYQEVGIMIMLSTFPHFCKIIGYTEKPLSIVLKYYADGSLYEWLRSKQVNATNALKCLKEISRAVETMHNHYLAHCDLKTQNVLVENSNGVLSCFLTDFGITQVLSDRVLASKLFNVVNLRGLSVYYAAPESFKDFALKSHGRVNYRAYDLYSLGCVAFEVLTRKTPWS